MTEETQTPPDEAKTVVVTKVKPDDKTYVRAVVHADEESAKAYLEELLHSHPWQHHSAVSPSEFAKASESTDETGKDEH